MALLQHSLSLGYAPSLLSALPRQTLPHFFSARQACSFRNGLPESRARSRSCVTCRLEPLPPALLKKLLPTVPTRDQWVAYWGRTAQERQGHVMETLGLGFLWMWGGFFLSRTVLGNTAALFFWWCMLAKWISDPLLSAFQKNRTFRGGNWAASPTSRGVKGALFRGRVQRAGDVVAPSAADHHLHYRMTVEDEEGRLLTLEAPLVPEYHCIRRGMACEVLVLSSDDSDPGKDSDFEQLTAVTEAYVPACRVFMGQYPYLNRPLFLRWERRRAQRDAREAAAVTAARDTDREGEREAAAQRRSRRQLPPPSRVLQTGS